MEIEINYLQQIIIPLLEFPDDLNIQKRVDDKGVFLVVKVAQSDMGRVIGKLGETATAIRKLIRQFGMTHNMHISLKIDEPITHKNHVKNDLDQAIKDL